VLYLNEFYDCCSSQVSHKSRQETIQKREVYTCVTDRFRERLFVFSVKEMWWKTTLFSRDCRTLSYWSIHRANQELLQVTQPIVWKIPRLRLSFKHHMLQLLHAARKNNKLVR
jgi:hypothetical protein